MSTATRNRREEFEVIDILDSDDEATRPAEIGPSSRQPATGLRQKAGTKRSRNGDVQPPTKRRSSQHGPTDPYMIDLTCAGPVVAESTRQHHEDVCILASDSHSPAAKRRNIAVAKALEAHRNAGKQIASKHNIQQVVEAQEKESKPKCGICLDEMKEPACGSCGHVFCKPCLLACLKATKKCPTCRKTLQPRTVHRIYLS